MQITSIKGFPNELLKKNRGGNISFVAEIGGNLQECGRTILNDDSSIPVRDGIMSWNIDSNRIQNLKASQPKIKVHIQIKNKSVGFTLMDIRDIGKDKKAVWLKLHGDGFKNGEIQIKSKMTEQFTSMNDSNISTTNIANNAMRMNYENKRVGSVDDSLMYQLHMSISEFRNIQNLCQLYVSQHQHELSINTENPNYKYIFSWKLFLNLTCLLT